MRKRWLLLGLGLLMLLGANLRPAYRVSVGGERLPGLYTLREVLDCTETAQAAAEEILDNSAPPPALRRSFRLSLRAADGDPVLLTDALLRATRGVTVSDAVIVNGTRIGTVEDGDSLCAALRNFIENQMPMAAVSGNIGGKLELQRVYTREGCDTPYRDMVLLVTGMAPVVYVDAEGKLA